VWTLAVLSIVVVGVTMWWFRRSGGHDEGLFAARASGYLFDLGLDVKRLPDKARAKFFQEAHALHSATKGRFHPKRFAMRFFGWYCTENKDLDLRPFLGEGVISSSIPIMRSWASAEPELSDAAEKEVMSIVQFLSKGFENSVASDEDKFNAQLALLELASPDKKSIFVGEESDRSDVLQSALENHILVAKLSGLYDSLAGSGRSLTWCCALSLYAAMRTSARIDRLQVHRMAWNSIVHRVVLDMLEEDSVSMGDAGFEALAAEANCDIDTVNRIVDESQGKDSAQIVDFLANFFGCGYQANAVRVLNGVFEKNLERSRTVILPHFIQAFS
jgi:hypothetical protein